MRRFEFVGGTSSKFWEIEQSGTQVTVRFGRIGSQGQTQTKDLGSWDDAAERVRKLIQEKLSEGYVEVGERAQIAVPPVVGPAAQAPYEIPPLPRDGPVKFPDVALPAGRRLKADPQFAGAGGNQITDPVIWATDSRVEAAGRYLFWLRHNAAAINLVPVLLNSLEADEKRPWDSGEFTPADPRPASLKDARFELAHLWAGAFSDEDEESLPALEPFGRDFPGLAPAPAMPDTFADDRDLLEQIDDRRIALVAAQRPADIVAAVGWMGAVNVIDDPTVIAAVLRSWEIRFNARLVEIGFDTLALTVGNPPRDEKTAVALAAEHFALCPDNVWQGSKETETVQAYGRALVNQRIWNFWWD